MKTTQVVTGVVSILGEKNNYELDRNRHAHVDRYKLPKMRNRRKWTDEEVMRTDIVVVIT